MTDEQMFSTSSSDSRSGADRQGSTRDRSTAPPGAPPDGALLVTTDGLEVMVPDGFAGWDAMQRDGFLMQHRVNAAEGRMVAFAYECVQRAQEHDGDRDPWATASSIVSASMALSRNAATRLVSTAVELTERLPRTAALLAVGWIGLLSAHIIVDEIRTVDPSRLPGLDEVIAEKLGPTRRRSHAPKLGPLRRMLAKAVAAWDPLGAAARAREARRARDVHLEPLRNDLAMVSATLSAENAVEIVERVEALARTAAEDDPRTLGELRAAGLLALTRGWTCLPDVDGELPGDADAQNASRRVVLHVYQDGGAGPGDGRKSGGEGVGDDDEVSAQRSAPAALVGYGPLTVFSADELERSARKRIEDVADLADPGAPGARRYAASESLRLFCQGRDGTCVFPGCQTAAEKTDLDHIIPFDHEHPEQGGCTTSDDLGCLCRFHHRLKTEGVWAYYRDDSGAYVWIHGPNHPGRDPGTRILVPPSGPLSRHAPPVDPETSERQRTAAEAGRTGDCATRRPHLRSRREAERRRVREEVRTEFRRERARQAKVVQDPDDAPPF